MICPVCGWPGGAVLVDLERVRRFLWWTWKARVGALAQCPCGARYLVGRDGHEIPIERSPRRTTTQNTSPGGATAKGNGEARQPKRRDADIDFSGEDETP